jgi:hypothetical protein
MAKVKLRWFQDIHFAQKGELGEAIAKAYVLEQVREKAHLLDSAFTDSGARVYDRQNNDDTRITVTYADTGDDVEWIPDFQVQLTEDIGFREREQRREERDDDARKVAAQKELYAEVKTSKSRSYPSDKIDENQKEVARYLALQDNTIVIAVMVTLRAGSILIHTYQMEESGEWEQVSL